MHLFRWTLVCRCLRFLYCTTTSPRRRKSWTTSFTGTAKPSVLKTRYFFKLVKLYGRFVSSQAKIATLQKHYNIALVQFQSGTISEDDEAVQMKPSIVTTDADGEPVLNPLSPDTDVADVTKALIHFISSRYNIMLL